MNKVLKISIIVIVCLIVILAAALLISQCSNNGNGDKTTTTTTTSSTTKPTTSSTSSSTSGNQGGDPDCTEHVDANTDYVCDVCGEQLEKPDDGFTATNDKVYVITSQLNIRKTPDTNGNPVGSVLMDEEITRLGYYENGWSKIIYDGEECYVKTDCLTTQSPITDADFSNIEETVYLTRNEKVYSRPSLISAHQYSEEMDTLFVEKSVIRLGVATKAYIAENGTEITFAKVKYTNAKGQEVVWYIDNTALTTEAPANPDGAVTFEENTDVLTVIAEESIWLRKSTFYGGEYTESEKAKAVPTGTILQATHKGIEESDGTVWYKVVFEGKIYYVIYKESYFDKYEMSDGNFENIFGEYNITLSGNFVNCGSTETEFEVSDGVIAVNIANTGALPEGTTAQYFAAAMIDIMQLTNVEVMDNNGVVYFEFEITTSIEEQIETSYCLVVLTAGTNNNFYVTTFAASGTQEDLAETFWGYVDTITINPET